MPAHQLKHPPFGAGPASKAVARVLAGKDLNETADEARLAPELLVRLLEVFTDAGYRAVEGLNAGEWWQVDVAFDPEHDHTAAARLASALEARRTEGDLERWWYLRKRPGWRLRLHPTHAAGSLRLERSLDTLVDQGALRGWRTGIYEPETAAFGGPTGMGIAHELFCVDSRAITHLPEESRLPLGRKQLSLMLCTALMRSAGLEPLEHGDVWDRVCALRPLPEDVDPRRVQNMIDPARTLLAADTSPTGAMFGPYGILAGHRPWADGFSRAGSDLYRAGNDGSLQRGVRQVVAQLVIFHWNRLAFGPGVQAALARAARAVVLDVRIDR